MFDSIELKDVGTEPRAPLQHKILSSNNCQHLKVKRKFEDTISEEQTVEGLG
jgi:hypothetical protein